MKNNFVRYPSPAAHLVMGVTLSLRARDLHETISYLSRRIAICIRFQRFFNSDCRAKSSSISALLFRFRKLRTPSAVS
jgi:hypothetical protein